MEFERAGRIANALLAGWLCLSTFLWPYWGAQQVHHALVAAAALTLALAALFKWPLLRLSHAALGAWLVVSPWIFDTSSTAMVVNDLVVGTLMFGFAFFGPGDPVTEQAT